MTQFNKNISVVNKEITARIFRMYGPGVTALVKEQINNAVEMDDQLDYLEISKHYTALSGVVKRADHRLVYVSDNMQVELDRTRINSDQVTTLYSYLNQTGRVEYTVLKANGSRIENPEHALIMSFMDVNPAVYTHFFWKDVI